MSAKTILLGVTGGIAAYKAAELVRLFIKNGYRVNVAMTRSATEFITPLTLEVLSGNPVWVETFRLGQEQEIGHIGLVDSADLLLVAPATANIIGKTASGIADDLLSTMLCVAAHIPVVFAPSMNVNMFENPITQANIERLRTFGYDFVEPEAGELACGHEGVGRLAAPDTILEHVIHRLSPKDLNGEQILVSAGPTQEEIDPVRFLSNPSSGKMGFAIARAAAQRGAEVTLVTGPTQCAVPRGVKAVHIRSAEQMRASILQVLPDITTVVMTAAVSDFRPKEKASHKVKKSGASLHLELEATPDILLELGTRKENRILIGFAAETEDLLSNAGDKLKRKNLDMIVANDVSRSEIGFQSDRNQVKILEANENVTELPLMSKDELAHRILDRIPRLRGT